MVSWIEPFVTRTQTLRMVFVANARLLFGNHVCNEVYSLESFRSWDQHPKLLSCHLDLTGTCWSIQAEQPNAPDWARIHRH
jgi:hypothetical protein